MLYRLALKSWMLVKQSVNDFIEDDGAMLAAATAYYAAFSFFPLLLVLLSGLGFVLRLSASSENEHQAIVDWIGQSSSAGLAEQVGDMLSSVKGQAPVSGPLGLVALLVTAIGFFAQIDAAFDRIWKVPAEHSSGMLNLAHRVLVDRLKAFVMLLGLGLLIVASFIVGMVLTALSHEGEPSAFTMFGWRVVRAVSILALNAGLFTILYKTLPRVRIRWRDALPGGIFTAIVWEIGRQLLSLFVIGTHYSAYGVIGTFIAVMVWVYYASAILFLGAELAKAFGQQQPQPQQVGTPARVGERRG